MGSKVVVTSRAWQDLSQIIDYISRDNPQAAEQLAERLLQLAFSLEQAPLLGCRIKGFPDVRMAVYRPYLIVYKIYPGKKELRILRFWHGARDLKSLSLREE